jgi:hypothetical protein
MDDWDKDARGRWRAPGHPGDEQLVDRVTL